MKVEFMGQLVSSRMAKTKDGKERPGFYKLRFMTMPEGGELEVTATALPDEKYKFQPLAWSLDCTARMFQGLMQVTANTVHGAKPA